MRQIISGSCFPPTDPPTAVRGGSVGVDTRIALSYWHASEPIARRAVATDAVTRAQSPPSHMERRAPTVHVDEGFPASGPHIVRPTGASPGVGTRRWSQRGEDSLISKSGSCLFNFREPPPGPRIGHHQGSRIEQGTVAASAPDRVVHSSSIRILRQSAATVAAECNGLYAVAAAAAIVSPLLLQTEFDHEEDLIRTIR